MPLMSKPSRKIQGREFTFAGGFLRGLSAPAEIYYTLPYRRNAASDLERMRSDWKAIGDDLRVVMNQVTRTK